MTTYPSGYTGTPQGMGRMLTITQLSATQTVSRGHPEFVRRMFALMRYCAANGVPLGPGTLWRSYAQQEALHKANPGGSAAPGNSNHEGNNSADDKDAIAADMVPEPSWKFMRSALPQFGLICFISSTNPADWNLVDKRSYSSGSTQEPWHIQPKEVRYGRSGRTTRVNLPVWPIDPQWLTDDPVPPDPPDPPDPLPDPPLGGDMTVITPFAFFDSRDGHGPFHENETPLYMPVYIDAQMHTVPTGQCSIKIEAIDAQGGGFIAVGPGSLGNADVPDAAACNYDGHGIAQIVWPTRTDGAGAVKLWVRGAATNIRLSVVEI